MEKKLRNTASVVHDQQQSHQSLTASSTCSALLVIQNERSAAFAYEMAPGLKQSEQQELRDDHHHEPCTFEDWQWTLKHSKVSAELAKAAEKLADKEEDDYERANIDPHTQHIDKRRRVWEPSTSTVKAVPSKVSTNPRVYRRQQESSNSGSSAEASTTVEANWSCSSENDDSVKRTGAVAVSMHEETESIATVTSQVDSCSLVNGCSNTYSIIMQQEEVPSMMEDVL